MQETRVQSLGWEDPLEEGMATYFSIPAWRIPWTEKPGGLLSMGSRRFGHVARAHTHTHTHTHTLLNIENVYLMGFLDVEINNHINST